MPTRFVIVCQVNYSALGGNLNLYHPFPILLLCHICVIWGTTNFGKCPPSTTFCFFMDDILDYSNLKHCHLPAFQKAKYLDPVQKAEDEKA